jgi:hypothetical protein
METVHTSSESEYEDLNKPLLIAESEINDLVRDLSMSKAQAELVGSRLKEYNLLQEGTTVSVFRKRQTLLSSYFAMEDSLCCCNDVDGLLDALGKKHKPEEWRLFIGSSKLSLKAVLLHNGNIHPSIPIGHAVHIKETYENMEFLLKKYSTTNTSGTSAAISEVIGILFGLQSGYTKYCCFSCEWDSRARTIHCETKICPPGVNIVPGNKHVIYKPLVDRRNIILPQLQKSWEFCESYGQEWRWFSIFKT